MSTKVFFSRRVPYALDRFRHLLKSSSSSIPVNIQCFDSEDQAIPRDEILRQVKGCSALFCLLTDRIDDELLDAAGPSLRVVSTMSVGYNHIDIAACEARGIRVGHTPGVLDVSTAETGVALTFAAKRRLVECVDSARNGEWGVWQPFQYCGTDVTGCTVGIIGLGRIGMTYARMMKFGFNCKIIYSGPNEKPEHVAALGGDVEYVDLDTLLAQSDIVSVHIPLNESTRASMNARRFAQMKDGAVFINTSRGEVVDQDALYQALKTKQIAAAGLDVTAPEPLPTDHALFTLPNCVILPHVGSATVKTRQAMADIAVQNLLAGKQTTLDFYARISQIARLSMSLYKCVCSPHDVRMTIQTLQKQFKDFKFRRYCFGMWRNQVSTWRSSY
ncbi:hypothetical protein Poli38472_013771 [Pythium oligandrum]|uniref:Uncharacterized protein n=1 Tax=Pythium oligandrum TaxID=41045 RepID=A0A8K1CE22_PYTOL|nr:hypothetical protein Poli38472_013771 [Pythium oligandrum]|eukprot:TMW61308.1 hypothetical protein Poli38472_013771 [Pythium oligandrum]